MSRRGHKGGRGRRNVDYIGSHKVGSGSGRGCDDDDDETTEAVMIGMSVFIPDKNGEMPTLPSFRINCQLCPTPEESGDE